VEHTKPETVRSYLTGLRSHYIDHRLPTTVFEDERIKRILRGSLRKFRATPIRPRAEITKDILERIIRTLGYHYDDTNIRAAFTTAFAGFLRAGELTWESWDPATSPLSLLSRGSVKFVDQGILLHLPKSKTDQFRIGHDILLSPSGDSCCPVRALQSLFERYPKPLTDPLFSTSCGSFNKKWFTDKLTEALLKAGIDPTTYSGHSFRRGAANTAIAAGIPRDEVKGLGRWKSDAVDRYFSKSTTQAQLFSANRRLHLAPSSSTSILRFSPNTSSRSRGPS
jgi:integrase